MPNIDPEQLRAFADDGYIVLSEIVSLDLIQAARRDIAARVEHDPPPAGHRGPHFYFLVNDLPQALLAPLYQSGAMALAGSLIAPAVFEAPDHVQISLNMPPWNHRPGGPHIDGLTPPEADGRPGTFTMLAGIFLTDQSRVDAGNLWVWPGSHRRTADYLREHGPEALLASVPYPSIDLGQPRQVTGRAGDVLLAHYMLGHNIGGNTSDTVREVLYFRLRGAGHRERWREIVLDPLLEFGPIRAARGER
jgi:ectoine hydroxylase-related dioxygenase (phytanoyl-CoA dioxygenase family)